MTDTTGTGPTTPATPPPGQWTAERIRALGAVTDIPTTAQILGLSRSAAYHLARHDQFPIPVLRVGSRYRVPVAAILTALHLPTTNPPPPPNGPADLMNAGNHASITTGQSEAGTPSTPAPPDEGTT